MKILKEFKIRTKDELLSTIKEKKVLMFFRVYQKFIQLNIINPIIYIIIILIEYLQLFYEVTNNYDDYIKAPNDEAKNTTSFYIFKILQYINFSHFITPVYLSLNNFIIIFIVTVCIILLNFTLLIFLDFLNKRGETNKIHLQYLHIILAFFNYINMKILIIPFTFILTQSLFIEKFYGNDLILPSSHLESISYSLINSLTNRIMHEEISQLGKIFIIIVAVITIIINVFTLITTSLLYNDLDPIEFKLYFAQSYPQIEMYNITLKICLSIFNILQGEFIFLKSIFILVVNAQRCSFRFLEWYYSWSKNQILLITLDFGFLFYNLITFFYEDFSKHIDLLFIVLVISFCFGIIMNYVIQNKQKKILVRNIKEFKSEREYCQLIIQLIKLIQSLSNENKSINDPVFFGFLKEHQKICDNNTCISNLFTEVIFSSKSNFSNEIERFDIHKNEFTLYFKASKKNSFEMLNDVSKIRCEKVLYSLITCIISVGMKRLKKEKIKLLPVLEAYIYIHIFNNKFYALFQIMKFYHPSVHYREKFFFFLGLCDVLDKMFEENNTKFTSMSNITMVSNYYYYHEKFFDELSKILKGGKELFTNLIRTKPLPKQIFSQSIKVGISIKKVNKFYNLIIKQNPYEVNTLRLFAFLLDKVFNMKRYAFQQRIRLYQNIKYYLLNDKSKSQYYISRNLELSNKTSIKNFQENSDSCIMIISGNLENLGTILYTNQLITSVLGYDQKEFIGTHMKGIIPMPISEYHNGIILSFYKTGKRHRLDTVSNLLALHKNQTIVPIDLYACCLPNMQYGLLFIGIMRKSYNFIFALNNCNDKENNTNNNTINNDEPNKKQSKENDIDFWVFNNICDNKQREFKVESSDEEKLITKLEFKLNKGDMSSRKNVKTRRTILIEKANEEVELIKQAHSKNLQYKARETGVIIINEYFEILHMNMYALNALLGMCSPFSPGKIKITKIFKDFIKKKAELEKGEIVVTLLDLNPMQNLIVKRDKYSLEREKTGKLSSNTSTKIKMVKLAMRKTTIQGTNKNFYTLILIKSKDGNESYISSSSSSNNSDINIETKIKNENRYENESMFESNQNEQEEEKLKEQKIEKFKLQLIQNKYIAKSSQISKILFISLFFVILFSVIAAYILEMNEITSIKNKLQLLTKNESFIISIGSYVIESFLLIRSVFFPLTNAFGLYPIVIKIINLEKRNIYLLLNFISNDFSCKEAQIFRDLVSQEIIQFKEITTENIEIIKEMNIELAIKKIMFLVEQLEKYENYENMTNDEFFSNDYSILIKTKVYAIYYNYFNNFYSKLKVFSSQMEVEISNYITHKRSINIIFFSVCLILGILFILTMAISFYYSEANQREFLLFLAKTYDYFYEEKALLLEIFDDNLKILCKTDQNIRAKRAKLEVDPTYRDNYIKGEDFIKQSKTFSSQNQYITNNTIGDFDEVAHLDNKFYIEDNSELKKSSSSSILLTKSKSIKSKTSGKFDVNIINSKKGANETSKSSSRFEKSPSILKTKKDDEEDNMLKTFYKKNSHIIHQSSSNSNKLELLQRIQSKSKASKEEIDEEEDDKKEEMKSYTQYKISMITYMIEISISFIIINSFFVISIVYFVSYFKEIKKILKNEILINQRIQHINSMLIGINILLLFNKEEDFANSFKMTQLLNNINKIEDDFREILIDYPSSSSFYYTLVAYDNINPCDYFEGLHTYYNLINCDEFINTNGLTFEISQMYIYINMLYNDYNERIIVDHFTIVEQFNDPQLINYMIEEIFFIRLFIYDIIGSHSSYYLDKISEIIGIINGKMVVYLIILIGLFLVIHFCIIFKQSEKINDMTRVKVFFEDISFKVKPQ